MIRIKRSYEPRARSDGQRVLVDASGRRGMKKEAPEADAWIKAVAPSTVLRQWFGHRVERWEEFRRRYKAELHANSGAWTPILESGIRGTVTLLYSAHDVLRNGVVVLREYLTVRNQARRPTVNRAKARASHRN